MASTIIHICVAKQINKKLKFPEKSLYLGSIAPDLSKLVNETRIKSHFLDNGASSLPNIQRFIEKYEKNISDPFVMGYYIHLYTDYLWSKYFVTELKNNKQLSLLNGEKIDKNQVNFTEIVYSDYDSMNISLIDNYQLELDLFFEEIDFPIFSIEEISTDKLQLLVDETGILIANSRKKENYLFDIRNIEVFINTCDKLIFSEIEKMNILK